MGYSSFKFRCFCWIILLFSCLVLSCKKDNFPNQSDVSVTDPAIIKQGSTYYLFATGGGIQSWTSDDMKTWKPQKAVFDTIPHWIYTTLPLFNGDLWAPDISYHNGLYYLLYCVSIIYTNESVIGLATNKTLDRNSPDYKWTDRGPIIRSYNNISHWNALDPNLADDFQGNTYLIFGSFWQGIKMIRFDPDNFSVEQYPDAGSIIASRSLIFTRSDYQNVPGDNPIEGGFIYKRYNYYYLFASINYCCRGATSNYEIIVGRSKTINGNYRDSLNRPLIDGGGTVVRRGDDNWQAVGGNTVINVNGSDYLVYFGYDWHDNLIPKLRIERIIWDVKGFPEVVK